MSSLSGTMPGNGEWPQRPTACFENGPPRKGALITMAQFMLLFVGLGAPEQADDAETQAYTVKWGEWMAGLARAGALQAGGPFVGTGKRVERDATSELVLERIDIGGYALVSADSIEDAEEIARSAPHTALGGATLIRPIMARD